MAGPIDKIKEKLKKYPHARFDEHADSIYVHPTSDDGFPVSFHDYGDEFIVGCGQGHYHFDDEESALEYFTSALSDRTRLKVLSRGTEEYYWALEDNIDGNWVGRAGTGSLFFAFWRKKSTKYLQNSLIRTESKTQHATAAEPPSADAAD